MRLTGTDIDYADFEMVYMAMGALSPSPFDPAGLLPYSRYPSAGGDITVSEEQLTRGMATFSDEEQQDAIRLIQNDGVEQNVLIGLVMANTVDAVSSGISGYAPTSYSGVFYPDGLEKEAD